MDECFYCGAKINRVRLFDAISDEGVVKICEKCARDEHIPIIRRPTTFQLKEAERKQTFYERASSSIKEAEKRENPEKKLQETTLREIVDRNYESKAPKKKELRPEMIDNFHWTIMRARRRKKLTQSQLAKQIEESEAAIKMVEQGILPEDDYKLVNKLENFLNIRIIRPEFEKEIKPEKYPKKLSFERNEAKILTIDDLRKMKEEPEFESEEEIEEIENNFKNFKKKEEDIENREILESNTGEISKKEMDRILFGR